MKKMDEISRLNENFKSDIDDLLSSKDTPNRVVTIAYPRAYKQMLGELEYHLRGDYNVFDIKSIASENTIPFEKKIYHKALSVALSITAFLLSFFGMLGIILSGLYTSVGIAKELFDLELKNSDVINLRRKLGLRRQTRRKRKKVKRIVFINDYCSISSEELKYVNFLTYLISENYLTNTALVVCIDEKSVNPFTHSYRYEMESLGIIVSEWLPEDSLISPEQLLDLFNIIGVQYYPYIKTLVLEKDTSVSKVQTVIEDIIKKVLGEAMFSNKEFVQFMHLCSLLFEPFFLRDIEQLYTGSMSIEKMIDEALKSKLLICNDNNFFFLEFFIREYYRKKRIVNKDSTIESEVFHYLRDKYPEKNTDIAFLASFLQLPNSEIESYLIAAWYHDSDTVSLKERDKLRTLLLKYEIAKEYLNLSEGLAKTKHVEDEASLVNRSKAFLDLVTESSLSYEAKCCCYHVIVSILFPLGINSTIMNKIIENYLDAFKHLKVMSRRDNRFVEYVADALMLAMSDGISSKQRDSLERLSSLITPGSYISVPKKFRIYRLGNALLKTSDCDYTRLAYEDSENYPRQHILSSINYSASLITSDRSNIASEILREEIASGRTALIDDISISAIHNNLILSRLLSKEISPKSANKKFLKLLVDLKNRSFDDKKIIHNNYASTLLLSNHIDFPSIETELGELANDADIYHRFFTHHNLLICYSLTGNEESFNYIKSKIEIPHLFRNHEQLFYDKFDAIEKDFEKCKSIDGIANVTRELRDRYYKEIEGFYLQPLLWGVIERWFE